MSNSNAASSAQALLDALLELRRFGPAGIFSDSNRFRAFMLDLRPGLKKEVRVLSSLIDAGYLQRLQDAAAGEREIVSAQMKLWLDEELMLNAEKAQYFSEVLLAFFSGAVSVSAAGFPPAQFGAGVQSGSVPLSGPSSQPLGFYVSSADECIVKGARLYAKGQYREAADWYRRAAEQGDADAQYMLGNMYRDGVGVDSDWDVAVDWYCRAAVQDHAEAKQVLRSRTASAQKAAASAAPSLRDVYANKRVGDRFEFGRYPQGRHGEVRPVTWRVLRRETDRLLVISERGLDCKPYYKTHTSITWADCFLRRWLNDEFYNQAFNGQERALILQTRIANIDGSDTDDRVFLLSIDEAESFFVNNPDRRAFPTDYAVNKIGKAGFCCWWLRSRGRRSYFAAFVDGSGDIDDYGLDVDDDECGVVRPAFKIAL